MLGAVRSGICRGRIATTVPAAWSQPGAGPRAVRAHGAAESDALDARGGQRVATRTSGSR
ncbi:hypothetical protein ACFSM7_07015 [Clavibacter michiganensis subsp. tessellarius]|uniref:hypothetical protein n=1 Tax=Clavibacter tessellarius TaxID=31965 RepID=UPI00362D2874